VPRNELVNLRSIRTGTALAAQTICGHSRTMKVPAMHPQPSGVPLCSSTGAARTFVPTARQSTICGGSAHRHARCTRRLVSTATGPSLCH